MTAATLETSRPATPYSPPAHPPREEAKLVATIIHFDRAVVVRVEGEAHLAGLDKLQFAFARVLARRPLLAVLDLSQLTLASSLALGQFVRLRRDLGRWNGRVKIANCPPRIREAFDVSRLADFFEFHATVEDALPAV